MSDHILFMIFLFVCMCVFRVVVVVVIIIIIIIILITGQCLWCCHHGTAIALFTKSPS